MFINSKTNLNEGYPYEPQNSYISDCINRGLITVDKAANLNRQQLCKFNSEQIRLLIDNNRITIDQVLELDLQQRLVLENTYDYINRDLITAEQAKNLSEQQISNLNSERVRWLIDNNHIAIDQALALTQWQRWELQNESILNRVIAGILDIRLVHISFVQDYVNQGLITLERAINLTGQQAVILKSESVRELINGNRITVDQILEFTNPQLNNLIRAVNDWETWRRLRDGEITVQDFLNQSINRRIPVINHRQSTHTASVHKSVSESALRLFEKYGSELNIYGLENVIKDLSKYVQSLPNDTLKNRVAKQAIRGITEIDYTDRGSGISARQILAVIWIAINKIPEQLELFETAKERLVEGFYEMAREYNLQGDDVRRDIADTDNGRTAWATCISGSFNKPVEKMNTIFPEVEIIFINHESACMKLQSVVKEKTLECLRSAKQDKPESFPQLLEQINNEGVQVIWDEIREQVNNEMVEDFSSLFRGGSDGEDFRAFIDGGKDTDIGQLISDLFKKNEENDAQVEETRMSFTPL